MMLLDHPREKFAVGATTLALQIPTHTFGSAVLMRAPKPRPASELSEIAFSVYYPTNSGLSTKKYRYLDWIVRWSANFHDPASILAPLGINLIPQTDQRLTGWHRLLYKQVTA